MKYLNLDESGAQDELTVQYTGDTVVYSTSKSLPTYIGEKIVELYDRLAVWLCSWRAVRYNIIRDIAMG